MRWWYVVVVLVLWKSYGAFAQTDVYAQDAANTFRSACASCMEGDVEQAVSLFDEALKQVSDTVRRARLAYQAASVLYEAKQPVQARDYCTKALQCKADFGQAYILLASIYASNIKWSKNAELNKCTYFLVIDQLLKAKEVDASVSDEADEAISTYASHTPKVNDLFMLGYRAGDRITIGGWIGETTMIR